MPSDRDLRRVPLDTAEYLMGPSGSITIHNCRTIHGSRPNLSDLGRPLLLNVYSAADAFTYTANPLPSRFEGTIVRGRPAALRVPRPTAVPDSSGLVRRLHVAVRLQQEEGLGRGSACGGCGADPGHPGSRSRRRVVAGGTRDISGANPGPIPLPPGRGFYAPVFPVCAVHGPVGRSVTIASAPDERNDSISSDRRNVQILVAIPSSRARANRSGLMSR